MPVDFTVGLVVGERRDRAARCLSSLVSQNVVDRMEILVLEIAPEPMPPLPDSNHPRVRVIKLPGNMYAQARVHAVEQARGSVVGFIEEHAWAFDGWADAMLAAHQSKWAGVGAEVHIGNPDVADSRIIGIMNHTSWLAPAVAGVQKHLPGHNSAYKREFLLRYGAGLRDLLKAELTLCKKLIADGEQLYLEPKARFAHINETTLRAIARGYFWWNRCYGDSRVRQFHWSPLRKAVYTVGAPLMPFYYLAHFLPRVRKHRPDLYKEALAGITRVFLAQVASAAGHVTGVLFGAGDAEARFTDVEVNEEREMGVNAA